MVNIKDLADKAKNRIENEAKNKEGSKKEFADLGKEIASLLSDSNYSEINLSLQNISVKVSNAHNSAELESVMESFKDDTQYDAAVEVYNGILDKTKEITNKYGVEFDDVYENLAGSLGDEYEAPIKSNFRQLAYSIKKYTELQK